METKVKHNGNCLCKNYKKCNLYRSIYKKKADGSIEEIKDCQINHVSQFLSDLITQMLGVQSAVESRGNDMVNEQRQFNQLATNASQRKRLS